jgi:hypothetical protein
LHYINHHWVYNYGDVPSFLAHPAKTLCLGSAIW